VKLCLVGRWHLVYPRVTVALTGLLIVSHSKLMSLSVRQTQTGVNIFSNIPPEPLTLLLFFVLEWALDHLQEVPKHASRRKKRHLTTGD
jgi:hypothetical protein